MIEYLALDVGDVIDFHDHLFLVCNIPKVYISRRALKHFVERRKEEMILKYSIPEIIERLFFAIENLKLTIQEHDHVSVEGYQRYIYSKYFETRYKSYLRIVTETIIDHQEIKSIHYKKNKNTTS